MDPQLLAVLLVIAVALTFDYINGFHDAANSIATVVSTRVLSPGKAVVWAAFFNFVAAFGFGTAVAKTVGAGMVDLSVVTFAVILGGLLGAIIWDLITWYYGLPTSSSHALFGGYAGAAVAKAGWSAIIASGWTKTLIFIVLSPLIGMAVGLTAMTLIYWVFKNFPPGRVDHWFRRLQLVSAAGFSLMHGANDAQKTMGIVSGALVTGGFLELTGKGELPIPIWVVLLAHAAIGLGTLTGGWRIIHTMGSKITKLQPQDARHHRRDRRCGSHAPPVRGPLGRRRSDRVGVDSHHPHVGLRRRGHLYAHSHRGIPLTITPAGTR
jgi:inorganic phosphate transporter, PiT family